MSLRTLGVLAADNLRASRGQTAYLILTLAIATAAWLTLAAVATPSVGETSSEGFGITIRNGSQNSGKLPLSYAARIEAIRGARDVFWYGMNAVKCTAATTVGLYALGGPGVDQRVTAERKVPAATLARWNADPLAVFISDAVATKCGWTVGQGVDPPTVVFGPAGAANGRPIELHVVGTFHGASPLGLVHYAYTNRTAPGIQGKDNVVTYFASAVDPRGGELLAARIEAAFAHDFPAVNAVTNATEQNAWARFGKVQQLLALVMVAVLLCAASVLISVLAHTAVERKSRLALLQVLGFQRATLFGAFALEVLVAAGLGALVGLGLARLVAHALAPTFFGFITNGPPTWAWWGLPVWLAALVIAALAWPAGLMARLQPADYRAI